MEADADLITLLRYVEANPLRAKPVGRAQDWRWSSLGCDAKMASKLLSPWPLDRPRNWTALVNQPAPPAEQKPLEVSFVRGRPLGNEAWTIDMATKMGLEHTLNPVGRPKKQGEKMETVDVTFSASKWM